MDEKLINALAEELHAALSDRKPITPLTNRGYAITLDDAYRISLQFLSQREALGERVVGKKIGVTSKPAQAMLQVAEPDFGFLTDRMQIADGATVSMSQYNLIAPRAEGEIAFILADDLSASNISAEEVLSATEAIAPSFEIVDSRITDWKIRIEDTVADNASSGLFALSEARINPRDLDLAAVVLNMTLNGQSAGQGIGSVVLGHPCEAVAWLANALNKLGIPLRRHEIILSGTLGVPVPVATGDHLEMHLSGMGTASLRFTD